MTLPNDETPQGGWYADEIWLSGDSLDGKHTGGMGCWSYNECDVDPDCEHIRYVRADLHDTLAAEVLALRKRVEAAEAMERALSWALPMAVIAMESWRLGRCEAGHKDICGTYPNGQTWSGIYQSEVDDIVSARAARAAYRATGDV